MAEKDALSAESATTLRKLVRVYAEILEDVYSRQTAGDYTFEGVLYEFLNYAKKLDHE